MYVLCFTRPRYQVSVYRTIGPLVIVVVILGHNLGNSQVSVYRTIGPTLVFFCFIVYGIEYNNGTCAIMRLVYNLQ